MSRDAVVEVLLTEEGVVDGAYMSTAADDVEVLVEVVLTVEGVYTCRVYDVLLIVVGVYFAMLVVDAVMLVAFGTVDGWYFCMCAI